MNHTPAAIATTILHAYTSAAKSPQTTTNRRLRPKTSRKFGLVAVARNDMEGILNFCFGRRYSPYLLLAIDSFPLRKSEHDEAIEEIVDLNKLVEARVLLHRAGQRASQNAGKALLPKLKPESRKRTDIGKIHRKRAKQEPFLFAAKLVAPEFLRMDFESTGGKDRLITPEGLLSQVTKKTEDQDAFRRLCSVTKAISPVIEVEWSEELDAALASVEPELPSLEPIPADLLPKKIPRRAAPETRKAVRQRVGD